MLPGEIVMLPDSLFPTLVFNTELVVNVPDHAVTRILILPELLWVQENVCEELVVGA
jgi:hypothetical protein